MARNLFKQNKKGNYMKRIIFILGFFLATLPAIEVYAVNQAALDTIIKVEGKVMPVDVIKVTTSYVRFTVPGSEEVYTISRKDIHKIIYKNGRIEEYNKKVLMMIDDNSWEAVWLTEDKKDVESLYNRGSISAQSPPSARNMKAAKNSARIKLQKKAASLKAIVVLVTKKQSTGGYGEMPGYYYEGIAYGTEPLEEE